MIKKDDSVGIVARVKIVDNEIIQSSIHVQQANWN